MYTPRTAHPAASLITITQRGGIPIMRATGPYWDREAALMGATTLSAATAYIQGMQAALLPRATPTDPGTLIDLSLLVQQPGQLSMTARLAIALQSRIIAEAVDVLRHCDVSEASITDIDLADPVSGGWIPGWRVEPLVGAATITTRDGAARDVLVGGEPGGIQRGPAILAPVLPFCLSHAWIGQ